MVLNPIYFIISIYIVSSLFSLVNGVSNGGFYLFSEFFPISTRSYVYSFVVDFIFIVFLILCYLHLKNNKKIISRDFIELGYRWGYFIIVHQLLYIFFVLKTGAGVAGSGFSFGGFNIYNYYFILLSPDMLAFIILPFLKSNKQFSLGLLALLTSMLLRGWLAGVIYFIFLILIRYYPFKFSGKNIATFSLFSISVVLLLPILEGIKWGRRLGLQVFEIINLSLEKYTLDIFFRMIESTINRFSHLNYSALIFENSVSISEAYSLNLFKGFWMNGILYETYCRLFGNCNIDINTYLVKEFIDPYGKDWNVDTGISGWVSFLEFDIIFFVIFFLLLLIVFKVFVFNYLGFKSVNIFFLFTIFYFYNGWFSPYYNLLFYFFILSFISRVKLRGIKSA